MSDEAQLAYEARRRARGDENGTTDVRALSGRVEAAISQGTAGRDEQSLKSIVSDLWQHSEKLVKAELELGIALAKTEIDEHVAQAKVALRHTAIMSGFFYAGYLTLLAALVLGLSTVMAGWLAALAVGIVSALAGYWMLQHDVKQVKDTVASATTVTRREPISNTAAQRARH